MSSSSVTVVIPAFNAEKTILSSIQAVLHQSYSNIQIIVVDDGSQDNTAQIVKAVDRVKYIYQKNAGPASARNRGASEVRDGFIYFTDADCVPQKDWIKNSIVHFEDANVAVVAGSYGISNPNNILAQCIYEEIIYRHRHRMPQYPKAFGSYNFGVRKKIFNEVGGFEKAYRQASGEDNDLSYKIINAGYLIYFERESLVDHYHPTSLVKYLKEQFRHGFWRVRMYVDHPKMMKGDGYTFWKDIVEIPLAGVSIVCFILFFFIFPAHRLLSFYLLVFLFLLEVFFSIVIIKKIKRFIYYSFVMFLRAYARAAGLSSGILLFFLEKLIKKVK